MPAICWGAENAEPTVGVTTVVGGGGVGVVDGVEGICTIGELEEVLPPPPHPTSMVAIKDTASASTLNFISNPH
jgi:hypothetical protein